jgi:lipoprotein-anchoring transpeptidase ErfK/SrfK
MMIMIALASIAWHIAVPGPAAGGQVVKNVGIQDLTPIVAVQVSLDRAGFSPGVIDGQEGENTRKALDAYRQRHGKDPEPAGDPLLRYTITDGDVAGPFAEQIPDNLPEQAKLESLTYASVVELLAERFHATPALLKKLNPQAAFGAGEQINVPNVDAFIVPVPRIEGTPAGAKPIATSGRRGTPAAKPVSKPDVVVTVSRATSALTVTDDRDQMVFFAPVTTGSEHDPLPIGEWKVTGIHFSPKFHYNPDLFWDADPSHSKATLAHGPNNPVGAVWIDLSKEHYGLHGTPEPSTVGKTASHGCVRLTNWDALKLAGLVKPGTRVVFTE